MSGYKFYWFCKNDEIYDVWINCMNFYVMYKDFISNLFV